jgi:hypothetical protein
MENLVVWAGVCRKNYGYAARFFTLAVENYVETVQNPYISTFCYEKKLTLHGTGCDGAWLPLHIGERSAIGRFRDIIAGILAK